MAVNIFLVGKRYHYRYQLAGARVQRTTRESNKGRAQTIANDAYAAALLRLNGREPVPTLAQLIGQWEELRGPVASDSHRRGMDVLKRLHLYGLGELPITELDTERIERARNAHLATRKPSSANHWLRYLKLLVNWAVTRKMLPALPWSVKMLPEQKIPRAILPVKKVDAWLKAVDHHARRSPAVSLAVRLMYGVGVREAEAATACWEWVDWQRGTYTPGITKGKEAVPIPMPAWLIDYLRPLRKASGPMTRTRRGKQLAPGYAHRAMTYANKQAKVSGITPHRLRGTCATQMSEEGTPVQTIRAVMRHKDEKTTLRYLEVNMDMAVQAQERISRKIELTRRGNGEQRAAKPHQHSRA